MVCEIYSDRSYTPAECHKPHEKGKKRRSAHVCLNMLCFCLLKHIGMATLFSQLWILNNFEKNHQKMLKILDFRGNPNSKNFENLENLENNFEFSIGNRIENRKF